MNFENNNWRQKINQNNLTKEEKELLKECIELGFKQDGFDFEKLAPEEKAKIRRLEKLLQERR